jgi:hypothetical protein
VGVTLSLIFVLILSLGAPVKIVEKTLPKATKI